MAAVVKLAVSKYGPHEVAVTGESHTVRESSFRTWPLRGSEKDNMGIETT